MTDSLEQLRAQKCVPLKGAEHGLSVGEVLDFLGLLQGWAMSEEGKTISNYFAFKVFYRTLSFVN